MWRTFVNVPRRRVVFTPQLEALEQRQVLSSLTLLPTGDPSTAVTATQGEPLLLASVLLSGGGKTASDSSQGALNLGLQVNVALLGLLDVQAATNLTVGGETQGPALAVNATAAASLGGSTTDGDGQTGTSLTLGLSLQTSGQSASGGQRTGPSLNLSLSLNSPDGTDTGSGSTSSSGTDGNGGGSTLSPNPGGQGTKSTPGTTTPGTLPVPTNPSPLPLSETDLAAEAAASANLAIVSSSAIPAAVGLSSQLGLWTHTQSSAAAIADEDAQVAISLLGRPQQGQSQPEKDSAAKIQAAPASNLLPGRPASSQPLMSPNTGEGSEERYAPRGSSVIPLGEPEVLDTPDGSPWFFQLPEMLGSDRLHPKTFGPINNLTVLFLEDLRSIPRRLEQVMEWAQADGFSVSSWLLLGMAGIAACEVARRQFRENSSTDALEEAAGEPALV